MQTVVIVIHLMIVLAMIAVVLLQKSEGGGLGMGGGGGFLSSRGSANVLTRTTAILALGFFVTSLVLSVLAGFDRKPRSIIQTGAPASAPAVPGAPLDQSGGSLLDTLRGNEQSTPPSEAPQGTPQGAPSGAPQVPRSQ